jgi:hypothetical protein
MEPQGSLPCSQERAIRSCPKPDKYMPKTSYSYKIL